MTLPDAPPRLFGSLLQECAPAVCLHMLRLELSPGKVALPWIMSGFASYLPAEQVGLSFSCSCPRGPSTPIPPDPLTPPPPP